MRRVAASLLLAGSAEAGAWTQNEGHSLSITSAGWLVPGAGRERAAFGTYAEYGWSDRLTIVFSSDGEADFAGGTRIVRLGGGVRVDLLRAGDWRMAVEPMLRWQDESDASGLPFLIGEGYGYSIRADAGTPLTVFGYTGFFNAAATYVARPMAADEWRLDLDAGFDLTDRWQISAAWRSTIAPGDALIPGAYEKHGLEAGLRWRFLDDWAISLSVGRTVLTDRAPAESVVRVSIWNWSSP